MDERFMEQASAIEQVQRDAAIAACVGRIKESDPTFDGLHCIEPDCGEEIHPGRLELGKIRCLDCQVRKEKRQ